MASLNKVILIGNVGKAPDIRTTQNGKEIASFSLACSESWRDKGTGERKERTEWVNVVAFSESLVGVIKQYVNKGSKLYVQGAIATRKWTDKEGLDRYVTEVILQGFNGKIILLDGKGEAPPTAHTQEKQSTSTDDDLYDDIPL